MTVLFTATAVIIFAAVIVLIIDNNRFVVREYAVPTDKTDKPLTFVFLTDLHENRYGDGNSRVAEEIDRIRPDAVLIGGDMIIAKKAGKYKNPEDWMKNSRALLKRITEKYPCYYTDGNHEIRVRYEGAKYSSLMNLYDKMLKDLGVTALHNSTVTLGNSTVRLFGLEQTRPEYKRFRSGKVTPGYVEERIGTADSGAFNIVLSHNPASFEGLSGWGADLVLSGHYHGGIVRLPILGGVIAPSLRLFPKYSAGVYTIGRSTMILSCGMGMHTLPVRMFNPAELTVVRIGG